MQIFGLPRAIIRGAATAHRLSGVKPPFGCLAGAQDKLHGVAEGRRCTVTRFRRAMHDGLDSHGAARAVGVSWATLWAIVATMIENCKLSGVNPQAWLTQTLTKLANGHKQAQLDQLMPWNFNAPVDV